VRASTQTNDPRTITSSKELADALAREEGVVNADTAMRVGAVYACVRIIAESIAMLPMKLHRTVGEDAVHAINHAVDFRLRKRPNRWQSPFEFKRMLFGHALLRGNAYAFVNRGRAGVDELVPLSPDNMRVMQNADLSLTYEYTRRGGKRETFEQGDILHLRALSTDGVLGMSPITAAARAVGLALDTETHGARVFKNAARPSGALKHPQELSPEAAKRLREQFDDQFAGAENAGRTLVLEDGLEWTAIGLSNEDTQYIDSRKFQRSEIAMFFGVPPHMLGDVDKSTSWGSGIEQQQMGFLTHTLRPWIVSVSEAIERDLLLEAEQRDHEVFVDTRQFAQADFAARQNGYQVMRRNGVLSADEWRRLEGMNARPDAGGKQYIRESNMQPDDVGMPEKTAAPAPPAARFRLPERTNHAA
jgi:HK97 family phage portal protein